MLSKMYIDLHVKYPLFSDIKEPFIFSTEFRKILNMKFQENVIASGSRSVPCGRMDEQADWKTDRHDEVNNHFSQ